MNKVFIINLLNITCGLLTVCLWQGCTERMNIKTDNSPPVIVVYGELTDELKFQDVMLSRSSPYFDNVPNRGISNAELSVHSSVGDVYRFAASDSIEGLYRSVSKFVVAPGLNYSLSIKVDFDNDGALDEYSALTEAFPTVALDSLKIEAIDFFGQKNYFLYVYFQAPSDESYYLFKVYLNDSSVTAKLTDYRIVNDRLFRGQYTKYSLLRLKDISERERDSEEERERSVYIQANDKIEVRTGVIPSGYFDFIRQCRQEQDGENPMFGGPASNITTNINKDGVGYFATYCISRKSIVFTGSS
ncbi:MAG: DUF4249 domain-containing protein [Prevotellaceae bacterium]|nr:DUF4249 domain-containing protein [Prevotellaceae bacterium]